MMKEMDKLEVSEMLDEVEEIRVFEFSMIDLMGRELDFFVIMRCW